MFRVDARVQRIMFSTAGRHWLRIWRECDATFKAGLLPRGEGRNRERRGGQRAASLEETVKARVGHGYGSTRRVSGSGRPGQLDMATGSQWYFQAVVNHLMHLKTSIGVEPSRQASACVIRSIRTTREQPVGPRVRVRVLRVRVRVDCFIPEPVPVPNASEGGAALRYCQVGRAAAVYTCIALIAMERFSMPGRTVG
ncbi:hypothetical protein B0H11DRAFT_2211971 [Mycena galericulata]|nr:hypothetical protein B0H11DRAFT_2211971 [Mycena galericulata]